MKPEQKATTRGTANEFGLTQPGHAFPFERTATSLDIDKTHPELNTVTAAVTGTAICLETLTGQVTQLGYAMDAVMQRLNSGGGAVRGAGVGS